jgi:hypothetical protein
MDQKYRNLQGGRKSNLGHFLRWQLLSNLHGFWINQKILGKLIWLNYGQIGYLQPLFQIHQSSPLDKKFSMVIYKLFTNDMGGILTLNLKIKEDIEF